MPKLLIILENRTNFDVIAIIQINYVVFDVFHSWVRFCTSYYSIHSSRSNIILNHSALIIWVIITHVCSDMGKLMNKLHI